MKYNDFRIFKRDIEVYYYYTLGIDIYDRNILNDIPSEMGLLYDVTKMYLDLCKEFDKKTEDEWDENLQQKSDDLQYKLKKLMKYRRTIEKNFIEELNKIKTISKELNEQEIKDKDEKLNEFETNNNELNNLKNESYEE